MMEKKKSSLTVATNLIDFDEIDENKKDQIKRCFPVYFSEDEAEMKAECADCIAELKVLMEENKDDDRVKNYIAARTTIMRNQCPIQQVSDMYNEYLQDLKTTYPNLDYIDKPRYSSYFPNKSFPSIRRICKALAAGEAKLPDVLIMKTLQNKDVFDLIRNIYNFYHGRIPKAEQILLWYPDYLIRFFELQRIIMTEDGPLPIDQRYFLALMSASCYACEYLYNLLYEGFIEAGGDESWLDANSPKLPNKIKRVVETCYDLAYQPWMFLKEKHGQLAALLKGQDAWSRQELMQVLIIFAFYHSFSCYVHGMGILPELDLPRDPTKDIFLRANDEMWRSMVKTSPVAKSTGASQSFTDEKIANNMEILEELDKMVKKDEEEKEENLNKAHSEAPISEKADDSIDYGEDLFEGTRASTLYNKFFGDKKMEFVSTKQKKIDSDIYEWKTNGYTVVDEHFPEIAKYIDLKYDYIQNLTLSSFGEVKDVKTDPFRKSIFYYIELIHGYEHVDFEYKRINTLLRKELKLAVKTMGSTPQNLTFSMLNKFPIEFKTYEICHIALLVMEAKFQIELMYGFFALKNAQG